MEFSVKSGSPEKQRSACIVVGVFEPRRLTAVAEQLDEISEGYISNLIRRGDLVSIGNVFNQENLGDVTIYQFDEDLVLTQIIAAKRASFVEESWALQDVQITYFNAEKISTNRISLTEWKAALTPDKLSVATVKPEALSIQLRIRR